MHPRSTAPCELLDMARDAQVECTWVGGPRVQWTSVPREGARQWIQKTRSPSNARCSMQRSCKSDRHRTVRSERASRCRRAPARGGTGPRSIIHTHVVDGRGRGRARDRSCKRWRGHSHRYPAAPAAAPARASAPATAPGADVLPSLPKNPPKGDPHVAPPQRPSSARSSLPQIRLGSTRPDSHP